MIKPYSTLVFTCLFIPTLATAKSVDWSDYLAGMKADCDTYNLDKAIPANLKPSIAKIVNHRKLDDDEEGRGGDDDKRDEEVKPPSISH